MNAQIEDVYPLSPMQEGMLFHSLSAPDSSAYFQQFTFTIAGGLNEAVFTAVWQQMLDRHPALRSIFLWEELDAPLQVVQRHVRLPIRRLDWRAISPEARQAALHDLLQQERQQHFDLAQAPLARAILIHLAPELYQFVWCNHHLLVDGWSVSQLLGEALSLYEGTIAGAPPVLPATRPYRDYIAWLRQQDAQSAATFWKDALGGFSRPTPLAIGRTSAVPASATQAEARTVLPAAATDVLHAFAREQKVTLNTLVQGAWALLLGRYSGERDIVFGTPIASRPAELSGSDRMVGLFINTIPVRVKLPRHQRVVAWLHAIQQQQMNARQYHHVPLAQVQGWSDVPRGTPLFESLLVFENYPSGGWLARRDATIEIRDVRFLEQTNYPVTLEAVLVPELVLQVYYDQGRFERAAIERMLGHLTHLLHAIARNPQTRLGELDVLGSDERNLLLSGWNQTDMALPPRQFLHRLVEQQAATTPAAIAIIDGTRQMRYDELNARANQLARVLNEQGVRPGTHVGVCVTRSAEMVVALLGILKAGGTYVPLDPNYPRERIAFMLEDTAAPVLVTQTHLLETLPDHRAKTICVDVGWHGGDARETNGTLDVPLDQPAYLIYTSGSTGRPKGVMISHASAATFVGWSLATFTRDELRGVLASTSICFDLSIFELFVPLSCGGTCIIAEHALALPSLPAANQVTLINTVPSAMAQLARGRLPATIQIVNLAGEPLKRTLADAVYAHQQVRDLYNLYGPSEDTTYSTYARIPRNETSAPTIGRPIAQTCAYVLDARLQPVPMGVAGELYLSGEGLALGYHNRPDLTAERFVPHPWSKQPGARMYRTGDLVRYRDDGVLEHLGRIDHQVKIRGFRIELGEIEEALLRHPDVGAAVVVAGENNAGDQHLIGYVGCSARPPVSADTLRDYLAATLPEYMVPARFVVLDALPLTPNGKIDRKALPEVSPPAPAATFVAARTPTETALADIWAAVLGREHVGIHDNFFDLGGDSIISIQIVARATQAGLHLTPKHLFQHRTIAELAAVVLDAPHADAPQEMISGALPLTPIQHWFFAQRLPNPHHYNQSVMLEVRQPLDFPTLERAMYLLLSHHDALRLRFTSTADGWQQQISDQSRAHLEQIDLSAVALPELPQRMAAEAARLQTCLNIETGPLVAAALFTCGAGQTDRLLIIVHHLAVDGVSWRILLPDLMTLYQQHAAAEAPRLPAKTSSYQQWAAQLAAYASAPAMQTERDIWRRALSEPVAPVPCDMAAAQDANTEAMAGQVGRVLTADETTALLQQLPRAYHSRIDEVLLAAVVWAHTRWSGQSGLLLDLEGHGRADTFERLDVSRTVGWFTAMYPVLLSAEADLIATLRATKERLRAIPADRIGYGVMRYLSDGGQQTTDLPQAEISFNYLGQLGQELPADAPIGVANEPCGPDHDPAAQRPHLIEIGGRVVRGQLHLEWTYSTTRHAASTIERFASDTIAALRSLIAGANQMHPAACIPADFPLASIQPAELQTLVARYGALEDIYPLSPVQQGMLFHALYEPDSPVYHTQFSWTFHGELDAPTFARAWRDVVQRHAILRTAFVWEGLREPHQLVLADVSLPWHDDDWRHLPADEQQQRLDALLEQDRRQGFGMDTAPLMRVNLIRTGDTSYAFVWSQHHILLDGWCTGVLLREAFLAYEAYQSGVAQSVPATRPYRDYIGWLHAQDMQAAEKYWCTALRGVTATTPLPLVEYAPTGAPADRPYDKHEYQLSDALSDGLRTLARQHRLTLNTVVQGAWALLLSHYSRQTEVIFGCTVSGRPPALAGVETMVGLFINTLPVRASIEPAQPVMEWLAGVQQCQIDMREFEYTPLAHVQRWSQLPPRQPLFETNVVFENIPTGERGGGIQISDVRSSIQNNFPLTLRGVPEERLSLHLLYSTRHYTQGATRHLLAQLEAVLAALVAQPDAVVGALLSLLARHDAAFIASHTRAENEPSFRRLKETRRKAIRGTF